MFIFNKNVHSTSTNMFILNKKIHSTSTNIFIFNKKDICSTNSGNPARKNPDFQTNQLMGYKTLGMASHGFWCSATFVVSVGLFICFGQQPALEGQAIPNCDGRNRGDGCLGDGCGNLESLVISGLAWERRRHS